MSECGCGGHGAATVTAPEPTVAETGGCRCGCGGGTKDKGLPTGKDDLGLKAAPHRRAHGDGCGCGGGACRASADSSDAIPYLRRALPK